MNIHILVEYSCEHVFGSLGVYLGVELPGHMATLHLFF